MSHRQSQIKESCRIAVFNVKYSPNVGDGAIAESLESELERHDFVSTVRSVDLAGRQAYGDGLRHRGAVMALLQRLGPGAREAVSLVMLRALTELRLRPAWRRDLGDRNAVVIGGGQLIQGTDLNFPVKLDAAMREVRRRKLPCLVYGVGVAHTLSPPALRLFRHAFEGSLCAVYVRDKESMAAWNRHFAGADIPDAKLCWDPALLMDSVVPPLPPIRRERPLIGLGIASPLVLAHHSLDERFDPDSLDAFWVSLKDALFEAGFDITLFSNGAAEDEAYLDHIEAMFERDTHRKVGRITRPINPLELATAITTFDGVVSHRLHANILALAYRKPHVGLTWDAKLTSFFKAVDREDCALTASLNNIDAITSLLKRDVSHGLIPAMHQRLQHEAREGIEQAGAVLRDRVRGVLSTPASV